MAVAAARLRRWWGGRRRGQQLACLPALVAVLCIAHQLFMLTEQHAAIMGPVHERPIATTALRLVAAPAFPAGMGRAAAPGPSAPQPPLGDCPAQQAIIPLLLLLALLLGGLARRGGVPWVVQPGRRTRRARPPLPPPLPPAQRRALLQVFTI